MAHSVLVVDDRPEITRALIHILELDDRLTLAGTASDGLEAVEFSKHGCPDAIILDLEMPRMNGLEALPLLRKSCPSCVIIIYSSDPERAKAAPQLGADALPGQVRGSRRLDRSRRGAVPPQVATHGHPDMPLIVRGCADERPGGANDCPVKPPAA